MRKIILFIILSLTLALSFGASRTWNGAGKSGGNSGTDFNNGNNWLPMGALLSTDDLVVNLDNNTTNIVTLSKDLSVKSLTIKGIVTTVGNRGRSFTLDIGNNNLILGLNISILNSCTPVSSQANRPFNIIITNSSIGSLSVSGNLSATNVDVSNSNNSIQFLIYGNLTINGTTQVQSVNSNANSYIGFYVGNSPSKIKFIGDVVFGDNTALATGNAIVLSSIASGDNGYVEFDGNLNLGYTAATNNFFTAATVTFDGAGTQTVTHGNSVSSFNLANVVIGRVNSPTVIFANTNGVAPNNLTGDLTINKASVLDLNTLQFNRNSPGGSFVMNSNSSLKLTAALSTANGGTATPFAGSNFPSGFTTVTLDSTSTVEFNGIAQTIPLATDSTVYGNLTLSGSGIKTVGGNISIHRALDINSGVVMALGDKNVTLKSNAQTTAFVKSITSSNLTYDAGRFVIERYLGPVASWRLLATPVQNLLNDDKTPSISASWREGEAVGTNTIVGKGTRITGPASGGAMDEVTQRASMKSYNMANNTYVDVKAADLALPIQKDQGYYVFVRGDRTIAVGGVSATTLKIAGKLRTDNQTFSVIKNLAPAAGFQSVGNPYASRIDVRKFIYNNVSESFYIWNPTGGTLYGVGQYEVYVKETVSPFNFRRNGSVGGAILNTIESGQAFFLQNNSTTIDGTITIEEGDKIIGSSLVSRLGVTSPTLEINLFTNDNTGNLSVVDGVSLNFDDNYSNAFDNYDVRKISNTNDNISIKQGSSNLVVERRKTLVETDTIKLNIAGMHVAPYKLEIDPSVLGNLRLNAYFLDKFLQTETPVSITTATTVPFSITSDAASRVADRFMIVFRQAAAAPLPFGFTTITAERNAGKTNTIKWTGANEINMGNYSIERSATPSGFAAIGTSVATGNIGNNASYTFVDAAPIAGVNYYRVKATARDGQVFHSDVVKVVNNDGRPVFAVQPNPVVDKTMNIHFDNLQGSYTMKLVSKQGATLFTKQVTVVNESEVKNFSVANVAAGVYELLIVDVKGKKLTQTIFIQ